MIELGPTEFLQVFAVGGMVSAIGIWCLFRLFGAIRLYRRRKEHLVCRLCQLRYIDRQKTKLSTCPNCGGLNQRGGQRRL